MEGAGRAGGVLTGNAFPSGAEAEREALPRQGPLLPVCTGGLAIFPDLPPAECLPGQGTRGCGGLCSGQGCKECVPPCPNANSLAFLTKRFFFFLI